MARIQIRLKIQGARNRRKAIASLLARLEPFLWKARNIINPPFTERRFYLKTTRRAIERGALFIKDNCCSQMPAAPPRSFRFSSSDEMARRDDENQAKERTNRQTHTHTQRRKLEKHCFYFEQNKRRDSWLGSFLRDNASLKGYFESLASTPGHSLQPWCKVLADYSRRTTFRQLLLRSVRINVVQSLSLSLCLSLSVSVCLSLSLSLLLSFSGNCVATTCRTFLFFPQNQ